MRLKDTMTESVAENFKTWKCVATIFLGAKRELREGKMMEF